MKKVNKKSESVNKKLKGIYLGDQNFYSFIIGQLEIEIPVDKIESFDVCDKSEESFIINDDEYGDFDFSEMVIKIDKDNLTPRELEILETMSVSDIGLKWEDKIEHRYFKGIDGCDKEIDYDNNKIIVTLKSPSAENDYEYECEDDTCDICNVCMINKIASTPTDDLDTEEIYFMLDMLIEILIRYNLLTKEHREIDEGEINVNSCTHSELVQMTENIITKITNIMFDYAILD